ncbi:hypothetical protein [Rhizobium sp. IMFF44]|uniref:hypothetical protein n=1 Tax=Rhizobium sp. IMFF44 TaxID=3342350 RepID=UPI0035BA962B
MLKFNDPLFINRLYEASGNLTTEIEKALESEQYAELARLKGIEQGLVLAIEMAGGGSGRVPQECDTPFLPAAIAMLRANCANEVLANAAVPIFESTSTLQRLTRKLHHRVRAEAERQEADGLAADSNAKLDG